MRRRTFSALLFAAAFGLTACEPGLPAGAEPHRELNFLDMADQPKAKPQRADLNGEWATGMLAPPPGSVAVDEQPYPYAKEAADLAGAELLNPLEATPKVVARGKWVFDNVCITCHGPEAAGDGHLTRVFPKPPSLMTQKVRDWPDGRIFHVPMRGQGSMPAHSNVVSQEEIWSVIHYLRDLQDRLPVAPAPAPADAGGDPGDSAPPISPAPGNGMHNDAPVPADVPPPNEPTPADLNAPAEIDGEEGEQP